MCNLARPLKSQSKNPLVRERRESDNRKCESWPRQGLLECVGSHRHRKRLSSSSCHCQNAPTAPSGRRVVLEQSDQTDTSTTAAARRFRFRGPHTISIVFATSWKQEPIRFTSDLLAWISTQPPCHRKSASRCQPDTQPYTMPQANPKAQRHD